MTLKEYYQLLKTHDWHYEYSDDPIIWHEGKAERERLYLLASKSEECKQLLYAYSDWLLHGAPKPKEPEDETA